MNDILFKYECKVTIQQEYAFTAYSVRKHKFSRQKSITESDFAWIFARNYEGTE